jgi:excisionase family DNA binding protein
MQHNIKPEDLVTVSEVARVLRVSEQTVRNLDRRGTLPASRLSNGTRIFLRSRVEELKGQLAQKTA